MEFASGPFLHSGDRPVLHRRLVTTRRTRVFVSSAMQILSAAEAVDAPSARQRIAFSVIFVSLRGVDTSLPRASNRGVRATRPRGRSFARLQLQFSSWQGVKRRRELQIGTTDGLGVNCRALGAYVLCHVRTARFQWKSVLVGCARCYRQEARVLPCCRSMC